MKGSVRRLCCAPVHNRAVDERMAPPPWSFEHCTAFGNCVIPRSAPIKIPSLSPKSPRQPGGGGDTQSLLSASSRILDSGEWASGERRSWYCIVFARILTTNNFAPHDVASKAIGAATRANTHIPLCAILTNKHVCARSLTTQRQTFTFSRADCKSNHITPPTQNPMPWVRAGDIQGSMNLVYRAPLVIKRRHHVLIELP